MKKFLIVCICLIALVLLGDALYYRAGVYLDVDDSPPATFVRNEGKEIQLLQGDTWQPFEIRGVNMGVGIAGHFATEFAVTKADYLRWFRLIQEMGANTIRVYTILHDDFYNAFYEYNQGNPDPLYLIHGLWVNDYIQNSHRDAFDPSFIDVILEDANTLVDVLHGSKKLSLGRGLGSGSYTKDVSPWVLGYILGVEWEDVTVAYTDHLWPQRNRYEGRYIVTTPEASPFEAVLARIGDSIIDYETKRYSQQRLVAFSNWPTTDPFDYSLPVASFFIKIAKVDVEHIHFTPAFISGTFASYHVYPYYPDYLHYEPDADILIDEQGRRNTYRTYLKKLVEHHSIPVVISEFGAPSSRGMAQRDMNTGRNQGGLSETEQGQVLTDCYRDIRAAGCAGSAVFTWQDEWFKRTWNTLHSVDLLKTANWSDYQTNEQYFGLLSFDPGKETSICYVDGDFSEWRDTDRIAAGTDVSLSVRYDEKFVYLLARGGGFDPGRQWYIPLDVTPESGAAAWQDTGITFDRPADFVIALDGADNSRVVVQERYDVLRAMYGHEVFHIDSYEFPPTPDSPVFSPIRLVLQTPSALSAENIGGYDEMRQPADTYETGKLTYGNANPAAADFNSLADFCFGPDGVEIKLPWQLLNFSNPSEMTIHDDYYVHYGVENLKIKKLWAGVGTQSQEAAIPLSPVRLKGWGRNPTYHERLKSSYYAMKQLWGA